MEWETAVQQRVNRLTMRQGVVYESKVSTRSCRMELEIWDWEVGGRGTTEKVRARKVAGRSGIVIGGLIHVSELYNAQVKVRIDRWQGVAKWRGPSAWRTCGARATAGGKPRTAATVARVCRSDRDSLTSVEIAAQAGG